MQYYDLERKFSLLPDDLKTEAINFIDFLNSKYTKQFNHNNSTTLGIDSKENDNYNVKLTAKQLLKMNSTERKDILKKQALSAKKLYNDNPELIVPDLVDDIIE